MLVLTGVPERFLHLTATAWTAIGSIAGAVSIAVLVLFNLGYLRLTGRQTTAAEASLQLLKRQMMLANRPFVALHSKYDEDINARLVYAHNQGAGPAIDVKAKLFFADEMMLPSSFTIGCLATNEKFQFLIGEKSNTLQKVIISYGSMEEVRWKAEFETIGGIINTTRVTEISTNPPDA